MAFYRATATLVFWALKCFSTVRPERAKGAVEGLLGSTIEVSDLGSAD